MPSLSAVIIVVEVEQIVLVKLAFVPVMLCIVEVTEVVALIVMVLAVFDAMSYIFPKAVVEEAVDIMRKCIPVKFNPVNGVPDTVMVVDAVSSVVVDTVFVALCSPSIQR